MTRAKTAAKIERALVRLERGDLVYHLAGGQWRFGTGNKFVPHRVIATLPLERAFEGNNGSIAYRLDPLAPKRETPLRDQ